MVEATPNGVLCSRTSPRSLAGDHDILVRNTANMLPALKCHHEMDAARNHAGLLSLIFYGGLHD